MIETKGAHQVGYERSIRESKPERVIREPKQERSIRKKQRVLDAAKALFCEKGFYNVTTNEIAKRAGVSIGTLYTYFVDKESILEGLLVQYDIHFGKIFEFMDSEESAQIFKDDPKRWIRRLVDDLIALHKTQVAFHRELEMLSYSMPKVAARTERANERIRAATLDYMKACEIGATSGDQEAAAVVVVDFIDALVDRVVFQESDIGNERIIAVGVDAIYNMFTLDTRST